MKPTAIVSIDGKGGAGNGVGQRRFPQGGLGAGGRLADRDAVPGQHCIADPDAALRRVYRTEPGPEHAGLAADHHAAGRRAGRAAGFDLRSPARCHRRNRQTACRRRHDAVGADRLLVLGPISENDLHRELAARGMRVFGIKCRARSRSLSARFGIGEVGRHRPAEGGPGGSRAADDPAYGTGSRCRRRGDGRWLRHAHWRRRSPLPGAVPLHRHDQQGHLQARAAGDDTRADEAGGGDAGKRERLTVISVCPQPHVNPLEET
jgi:hypothetical protein